MLAKNRDVMQCVASLMMMRHRGELLMLSTQSTGRQLYTISSPFVHPCTRYWKIYTRPQSDVCFVMMVRSHPGTIQGDLLAMAMFALAVKPLIAKLQSDVPSVKQVWHADDALGAGSCEDLRTFWESMQKHGAAFGYHLNAGKIHLVVKSEYEDKARQYIVGLGVNITTEGKRHLGAAIGTKPFIEEYITNKVRKWVAKI